MTLLGTTEEKPFCLSSSCNEKFVSILYTDVKNPFSHLIPSTGEGLFSYFLSKLMGYLIVVGSAVMKFPQILNILKSRSVVGLNVYSFYFECAENLPIIIYHSIYHYPFSTYGECILILVQDIILVLLTHLYTKDPSVTAKMMYRNFSLLILCAVCLCFIPQSFQVAIPIISTCFGLSARLPQIWTNFRQGHTGQLSLLSWSFSLVGSSIRIFTTLMEVPDKLILAMYITYFLCNLTLVLQIIVYWKKTNALLRK
ncbi:hypothetical protein WA171_004041, partial [Blastocystis sp. BT1]